jgi:hypothetical protein
MTFTGPEVLVPIGEAGRELGFGRRTVARRLVEIEAAGVPAE